MGRGRHRCHVHSGWHRELHALQLGLCDPAAQVHGTHGSGNPLYLTVNAIDGEGAARAVAQTLNSQAARSTTALRDR